MGAVGDLHKVRVGLAVFAGCVLLTLTGAASTFELTPQQEAELEKRMGYAEAALLRQSQVLLYTPEVQAHCQAVTDRLAAAAGHAEPVRVHVLSVPLVNALTLPSGDIFVFTGLIEEARNDDELAAVLGHELSHLVNHDRLRLIKERIVAMKRARVGSALLISTASSLLSSLVSAGISNAVGPATSMKSTGGSGGLSLSGRRMAGGAEMATFSAGKFMAGTYGPIVASFATRELVGRVGNAAYLDVVQALIADNSEADEVRADEQGLSFAAKAGFDPERGAQLRKRISAAKAEALGSAPQQTEGREEGRR